MFYLLNKSGIILDGIQSCFQTLEGSVACYHSAPLIFQRSGIGSAACFCKGSLCSAASRLKLQICSGGCGPTGMHPQTHNPCHSRSFSLSYAFFFRLKLSRLAHRHGHTRFVRRWGLTGGSAVTAAKSSF